MWFILYIVVKFYQYKANLSWVMQDYGLSVARLCPGVCRRLRDAVRDDGRLCLFTVCEVINGNPGLPANCQGQCSPEPRRVSAEIEKEIYTTPQVASFSLFTNIHTHKETYKIQHKLENPLPVGWVHTVCVDGEWLCVLCLPDCRSQNSHCQRIPERNLGG